MSHSAWQALNPLRNRCRSIFTKQACEEQTPTRLVVSLSSSAGRQLKPASPPCASAGQMLGPHRRSKKDSSTLCARFPFSGQDLHSLGWWEACVVGSSLEPSFLLRYALSNMAVYTELGKATEPLNWHLAANPAKLFILFIIPAGFY